MSAAEKLEALEKRMKNVRTRRIVTTPAGHELFITVSDALPEIIAVVEAAEAAVEYDSAYADVDDPNPIAAALSALDEALSQIGSTPPPEGATSP